MAVQNKVNSSNKTLKINGRLILFDTPKLMGILNVTPDSFYDGGRHTTQSSILHRVEKMISEGAHFIDVGGYSSRPDAPDIPIEEELKRVIPVVQAIGNKFPETIISIDTFRSEVARQALESGASMINDISAGELDKDMFTLVARTKVPYVMMHMRGTPQTMRTLNQYENLTKEVTDYFHKKIDQLKSLKVTDVVIDPGFGFAKGPAQNFELLSNLGHLRLLEKPILIGLSRKSMIWRTLETTPENALNGTTVLNTIALLKGADILRIHDVKEAAEAIKLTNFVK
ncbi:MAG TPA: dihydropteroate synthase [Cyclobacteriaceae bacterium]|nr:dihydropteroate synthase [Cyclobacteriaceae bacterium]HRW98753.1 dihydropteroate synthase [Cyclobacteriaceae bacterium]